MKLFLLIFLLLSVLDAKYYPNKSCEECHGDIYHEYQSSAHSKSYFNDILHKSVADAVSKKKYDCAVCHMPTANNLKDLIDGKARPDSKNITHTDAVSCYFCHTIAYVKKAHRYNLNIKAKQVEGIKPSYYGSLEDAGDNNKHESLKNPIYNKNICLGCHSHKLNENNVTIFRAMKEDQTSEECIKCHMPKVSGGVEDMDTKNRGHHISHRFLGIRDKEFRKKGVDINVSVKSGKLFITLKNEMAHPLIIQSAREKYLKIVIYHDKKIVWQNYKNKPSEDKQGDFCATFTKDGKKIIVPATADKGSFHNLDAKELKVLTYKIPKLNTGDEIEVAMYVKLAKDDCASILEQKDNSLTKPMLIKKTRFIYKSD